MSKRNNHRVHLIMINNHSRTQWKYRNHKRSGSNCIGRTIKRIISNSDKNNTMEKILKTAEKYLLGKVLFNPITVAVA